MDDVEKSDYFIKRHCLRVSEDETDAFSEAFTKRHLVVLNYYASISQASNATTCALHKDHLDSYASVVDCRGSGKVNNYADTALHLASHCKNESKEWQCQLSKQREMMDKIINKLECQQCANWVAPNHLSNLFLGSSDDSGGTLSPPRVRKNSDRGVSFLKELPTFVMPKDVRSPVDGGGGGGGVSTVGNIFKPEAQGSKLQSDETRPDFASAINTSEKSALSSVPQVSSLQPLGRSNLDPIKILDQPPPTFNKSFLPRSIPNPGVGVIHGGYNWNVGKPAPQEFQSNCRKELSSHGNSYDGDCFGNIPPGSEFERNGRGSSSAQRAGRGYGSLRARKADDTTLQDSTLSSMAANFFKTARDELVDQNVKKNNGYARGQSGGYGGEFDNMNYGSSGGARGGGFQYGAGAGAGAQKRSLGTSRRGGGVFNKFVPPVRPAGEEQKNRQVNKCSDPLENGEMDERLKNIDPKMIELIRNEIMDISAPVGWDDIAGLDFAKSTIQEIVVWPMLRPDIFTGLRKPPKGILLFGPPGTGKTLIGKCIASQSQSTFFSISASSLTSKWIGDGEKMVRALFAVARCHQPAVVFIDEIDSLLTQRSDTEHESSRRIKTEFLVQLDGAGTGDEDRILVVGATNRPQELDEAARRRLVKRLYIPLPEFEARRQIVERLMRSERNDLSLDQMNDIAKLTDGYSGADMKNVCEEASLGPIRSLSFSDMHHITADQVRPVNFQDFRAALLRVRASVSQKDLDQYVTWDHTYGMSGGF